MKRRRNRGESISETLVAVLLLSLAFLVLTGSTLTAARINDSLKNEDAVFTAGTAVSPANWHVTLRMGVQENRQAATLYETENGYYYYEYTSTP